jgi:ligand-binding sensor domain-containing protein/two-component sensor histidine kinase
MRLLLIVGIVLVGNALFGQKYLFTAYNAAEGLPQSQVTSITQDDDGYLWVGTLGGLARFNGSDFENFSTESGLLNNRITFLTVIKGALWIGHEGGVTRFENNKMKRWILPEKVKTTNVSDIVVFNNKLIVGTNGAGLFEITENKLTSIRMKTANYSRIRDIEWFGEVAYVATRNGVLKTEDFKLFSPIKGLDSISVSSIKKKADALVITTFEYGVYEYVPSTGKITAIPLMKEFSRLKGALITNQGDVWLNSSISNGILRIRADGKRMVLDEDKGLTLAAISVMFQDKEDNIWFGSEGKGLIRFPGERFTYFDKSTGFSSDLIVSINQDRFGNVWFGTYDKGVIERKVNGDIRFLDLPDPKVWASAMNIDKANWFGTESVLMKIGASGKREEFYKSDGLPGDKITCLLPLTTTQMYVGGIEGVSLYKDGKFENISHLGFDTIGTVRRLLLDDQVLYCASDMGLYRLIEGNLEKVKGIRSAAFCLEKDTEGHVLVGTEEGLFMLDDWGVKRINFSQETSSNFINFLNFKEKEFFVGTNNGLYVLSHFNSSKDFQLSHYGLANGVVDLETNLNSGFFDQAGNFWFGTASGVVRFKTSLVRKRTSLTKLSLKQITLNYQPFDYKVYSENLDSKGFPIDLNLPYSKNNLTFIMDGISLLEHKELEYQFWMEGLESQWSPKTKSPTISFSSLPSGNYTLHSRAVDSKGGFSDEVKVSFIIRAPFYKTWWFILLVLSFVALSVVQFFQFKIKREREKSYNETLEYKSKLLLLEQKSLNASMNRHFLFNALNSIQYFINTQDRLSANRYLTKFAKLVRKNLDSSIEEGSMIPLSQELERLELYVSLEQMRFKDRFDYRVNLHGVDAEAIIIPAMLLQPFVENSIMHGILPNESIKGLIEVDVKDEDGLLVIQIDDNGIGIENSMTHKKGLQGDHQSQGMVITTKRLDLIRKISNKKFELIGPYQLYDDNRLINGTRVLLKMTYENLED